MVAQAIANTVAACHGVKSSKLYKLGDFMPANWIGRKRIAKSGKQSIKDFLAFASRYKKQ